MNEQKQIQLQTMLVTLQNAIRLHRCPVYVTIVQTKTSAVLFHYFLPVNVAAANADRTSVLVCPCVFQKIFHEATIACYGSSWQITGHRGKPQFGTSV